MIDQTLRIITETEDDPAPVTRDDAPALFEAWDYWKLTPERSGAEKAAWDKVLEAAQDYMHSIDRDSDDVEDVTNEPETVGE